MSAGRLEDLLRERGRTLDAAGWLAHDREARTLAEIRSAAREELRSDGRGELRADAREELRAGGSSHHRWSLAAGLVAAAAAVVLFFGPRVAPSPGAGSITLYDSAGRPLSTTVRGGAEVVATPAGEVLVEVAASEPSWVALALYALDSEATPPLVTRRLAQTLDEPLMAGESRLLRLPITSAEPGAFVLVVALTRGRLPQRVFDARFPVALPGAPSASALAADLEQTLERLGAGRGEFFVRVLRARAQQ